MCGLDCEVAIR